MTDKFTAEPVIGHHVEAERYTPDSPLGDVLDDVAECYGIERRDRKRVRITVGDVDWDETRSVSMDVATFEALAAWFYDQ